MKRSVTIIVPAVAIAVAVLNGVVITMAMSKQDDCDGFVDAAILGAPLLAVLVCFALSVAMLRAHRLRSPLGKAMLWGAFSGGFLFLLVQALMAMPRYGLIAGDGTAYWGLVSLPTVYVGVPLLLLGGVIGLVAGAVLARQGRRQHSSIGRLLIVGVCVLIGVGACSLWRPWRHFRPGPAPTPIVRGMTKSQVLALRGEPSARRDCVLPEHFFVGAPAPYDCRDRQLAPRNRYEEWTYRSGKDGRAFIWFSHPAAAKEDWVVVGQAGVSGKNPL